MFISATVTCSLIPSTPRSPRHSTQPPRHPRRCHGLVVTQACGAAGQSDMVLRCLAEMNADSAPGKVRGIVSKILPLDASVTSPPRPPRSSFFFFFTSFYAEVCVCVCVNVCQFFLLFLFRVLGACAMLKCQLWRVWCLHSRLYQAVAPLFWRHVLVLRSFFLGPFCRGCVLVQKKMTCL